MLDNDQAVLMARRLHGIWRKEQDRLDKVVEYLRGNHQTPYKPRRSGTEYKRLIERSVTNMLPFIVREYVNALHVEGYRPSTEDENAAPWKVWQANGMDRRQAPVHRGALEHGSSYLLLLPGEPVPVMRGVSARKMVAVYTDPAVDDWPEFALDVNKTMRGGSPGLLVKLYDDTHTYAISAGADMEKASVVAVEKHGAPVCPIVRFTDDMDLDGWAPGMVEPLIPRQDRLNQTVFDLLMTQSFSSWKVRTATGMVKPETDAEADRAKRQIAQDMVLTGEDGVQFGTLDETPLDGFLDAVVQAAANLAVAGNVPPHRVGVSVSNLAADALAAVETGKTHRDVALQHSFGESWEQALRLAGALMGDEQAAADTSAQVRWSDPASRSLAQWADALGKLASPDGVGVPREVLWDKIPILTSQDVARAKALANDPMRELAAALDRQMG